MRKRFSVLFLILALVLGCFEPVVAIGTEKNRQNLFIATRECPDEVKISIQQQAADLIRSQEENNDLPKNAYLGQPFSYANENNEMFLFPVFIDNEIKYVIRVTPQDNGIFGTISCFLATELNELMISGVTSSHSPAMFYIEDATLVSEVNTEKRTVYEFSEAEWGDNKETQIYRTNTEATLEQTPIIQNIAERLEIEVNAPAIRSINYSPSKYLPLNVTEQQGSNNWCNAYCTAIIGRYHGVSGLTARQVMQYFYGANPSVSSTLDLYQAVDYARNALGLTQTMYINTYLSEATLKEQIDEEEIPVTLSMYRPAEDNSHAVVLRGYNTTTWSIWNPWYGEPTPYESFTIGGSYTARSGEVFQYAGIANKGKTIYNWKE